MIIKIELPDNTICAFINYIITDGKIEMRSAHITDELLESGNAGNVLSLVPAMQCREMSGRRQNKD